MAVDEQYAQAMRDIERCHELIAEMVFLLECFMEGDADAKRMNQATKVLAKAKEVEG